MAESFKFRYVNELVGVFVTLIVVALITAIVMAGKAQGWFEPVLQVRLQLPAEGTFGLRKGAAVNVLENPVGAVDEIVVADAGAMEAVLKIRGDFTRFIRADSQAVLKKRFAVAGDAYVEITRGHGAPVEDGAYLECITDTDVVEQIHEIVEVLRTDASEIGEKVKALMDEHTALATRLNDPDGDLRQLIGGMNDIARDLAKGEGTAGKLLRDPTIANDLTDVVLQVQVLLQEVDRLIRGLQKHWLVRKYIEPDEATGRLLPDGVSASP